MSYTKISLLNSQLKSVTNIKLYQFNQKNHLYISPLTKAYHNILVVIKQTPYEQYTQLKAQGKAPVALRWERLENRAKTHTECVEAVKQILEDNDVNYVAIKRDELHRGLLQGKDLLIAVGGMVIVISGY